MHTAKYLWIHSYKKIGGKSTGTYRFLNGYYGLTDMPASFQKTIDVILRYFHRKFSSLDEILVITQGTIAEHEKDIDKILHLSDKKHLVVELQKCKIAKKNMKWFGFQIEPTGLTPAKKKFESKN